MFELKYSTQATKFLKKTNKKTVKRILNKLELLIKTPFIHDSKTIKGTHNLFRIRIENYHALYEIDYKNNLIGIIKINKRTKIYKDIKQK